MPGAMNLSNQRPDIPFVSAVKVKIKGYDKLEIDVTEKKLFGCVLLSDNPYGLL